MLSFTPEQIAELKGRLAKYDSIYSSVATGWTDSVSNLATTDLEAAVGMLLHNTNICKGLASIVENIINVLDIMEESSTAEEFASNIEQYLHEQESLLDMTDEEIVDTMVDLVRA